MRQLGSRDSEGYGGREDSLFACAAMIPLVGPLWPMEARSDNDRSLVVGQQHGQRKNELVGEKIKR